TGGSATTPSAIRRTSWRCSTTREPIRSGWRSWPAGGSVSGTTFGRRSSVTPLAGTSDAPSRRTWSTSTASRRRSGTSPARCAGPSDPGGSTGPDGYPRVDGYRDSRPNRHGGPRGQHDQGSGHGRRPESEQRPPGSADGDG